MERGVRLLLAAALLYLPCRALASQESERLTAKGEAAFQGQRYEDARALFAEAVAADPGDATASYDLGLALGKLGRWEEAEQAFTRALEVRPDFPEARSGRDLAGARAREGGGSTAPERQLTGTAGQAERAGVAAETPRPWGVHATTGVQYDSNVAVDPRGHNVLAVGPGGHHQDRGDVAFLLGVGGRYDVIDRPNVLARFEYDFYQTLHPHLSDFNFMSHRLRGTVGYALAPDLWGGMQGGYGYYGLGSDSYLNEPYFNPFLSYLESSWGLSQLSYRRSFDTYLSQPFHELRDGPVDALGLVQTLYDGPRYLTAGYEFGVEHPTHSSSLVPVANFNPAVNPLNFPAIQPSDYQAQSHQAFLGVGFPAWWRSAVDLMYLFRYEDYTRPNSRTNFTTKRHDSGHHMYANLTRPINDVVSVVASYYGTVNLSNIPTFDYRRNVAGVSLQVAF
jgi:tetratricopeptide (TPR) repeat protein